MEDLERFGVDTLPTGSDGGVHYFHISPPELPSDSNAAAARQTRLDTIRDRMPRKASRLYGLGLGLGRPQEALVSKRSVSPFALAQVWIGIERPRALFVRPSEVVFILDAG